MESTLEKRYNIFSSTTNSATTSPSDSSATSLKMTPAIVPKDDSTILYGYFIEGESDNINLLSERDLKKICKKNKLVLPNNSDYDFFKISNYKKNVIIPVETSQESIGGIVEEDKTIITLQRQHNHLHFSNLKGISAKRRNKEIHTNNNNDKMLVLHAKELENSFPTFNKDTKIDTAFVGGVSLNSNELKGTIKLYLDRDIKNMIAKLMKEKQLNFY